MFLPFAEDLISSLFGHKGVLLYYLVGNIRASYGVSFSVGKKTSRLRMIRHFVSTRCLHLLALLMRLSPVDLSFANIIKCRSPLASFEKNIEKKTVNLHRRVRKQWLFLISIFKKVGHYHVRQE